jgi:hypothetical protein
VRIAVVVLLLTVSSLVRAEASGALDTAAGNKVSTQSSRIKLVRSTSGEGSYCFAESPNFRVYWTTGEGDLRALAERCERMAANTKQAWLGKGCVSAWTPKCDVVVHPETAGYVQTMGPGSEQTSGCATIRLEEGRVVVRRIDLRADALDWKSETLPHELTHVVLADRFCRTRISPWADVGIAMLAETPEKLSRRLADLRRVAADGSVYAVHDLLNVRSSPDPTSRAAFYGQSLALVSLLLDRGSREQLLQFVDASQLRGPDAALREVYGLGQASDFERQFREYLLTERPLAWSNQRLVAATMAPQAAATR